MEKDTIKRKKWKRSSSPNGGGISTGIPPRIKELVNLEKNVSGIGKSQKKRSNAFYLEQQQ